MTLLAVSLLAFSMCFATDKTREAYIMTATSNDLATAPGYIYGALSLISSIRKFDKMRDVLVLVDTLTLFMYPNAKSLFDANNVTLVLNKPLQSTSALLKSAIPKSWIGSFAKMHLLQLSLWHYEKLLYMDVDGTLLKSADEVFALPFSDEITAYGMRDLYGCSIPNDRSALMGAFWIWNTRSNTTRRSIEMASVFNDLLFLTRSRLGNVPDDQRLLSLLFGSRLRFIDEGIATNVVRCACKRENLGVKTLDQTVYAHFMHVVLDVNHVSNLVVSGRDYKWHAATMHTAHVPDCGGVAFRSWIDGLKTALSRVPLEQRALELNPLHECPEVIPECRPFVQTTIIDMVASRFAFDGNLKTIAVCPNGANQNDFITARLSLLQQKETYESVVVHFDDRMAYKPKLGTDYVFVFDDDDLRPSKVTFLGRRIRSVTLKFLRYVGQRFGICDIVLDAMSSFDAKFLQLKSADGADSVNSTIPLFVRRHWHTIDRSMVSDLLHGTQNLNDGNLESVTYIPEPWDNRGLLIDMRRTFLVCRIEIYAGDHDGDSGDVLANDMLYANDGAISFGRVLHKTRPHFDLEYPTNVFNLFLRFSGHKQWLRIREIHLQYGEDETLPCKK